MSKAKPAPFLHARVTAELPFELFLPSGLYPLKLGTSDAALPILLNETPAWVLGYAAESSTPTVLRNPRHMGIIGKRNEIPATISKWVKDAGLDRAVIMPASTILELWIPITEDDASREVRAWADLERNRALIVFLLNQFLSRYQAACGFTPPAGLVAPVSQLELGHLSVQFFVGDAPRSRGCVITPALPAEPAKESLTLSKDTESRFQAALRTPAIPLWLELAHDAYSLLYRNRKELSIIAWIQCLEVAVAQLADHFGTRLEDRATVEQSLSKLLTSQNLQGLEDSLRARLQAARQLRNSIIHDGTRLRFDDPQAESVAETVIRALALIRPIAGP
jgi:hypothetical protein